MDHEKHAGGGEMPDRANDIPITLYQAQFHAWQLTRQTAGDSLDSLRATLVDAQIDLNPHQVEAALFACRNPLSRGVILGGRK